MLAGVGSILVGLALAAALYAAFATLLALRWGDSRWADSGRNGVFSASGLLGLALLLLVAAFLSDQFQIRYVAQHSARALPVYLKISAVWAGQEGSLLLWSFLQALFSGLAVGRRSDRSRRLVPWATVFLGLITAFFAGATLFLSNPFARFPAAPVDGRGLTPLLRHPGMVFHPPVLYVGYVGLAVPFAFALAALITRHVDDWPAAAHRWLLGAWLFLGLGLLLGMRWAYDVLGWGGYWGWDPVENAGLMPWLTATALLHGAVMQGERRGFQTWNALLAVLSFLLVLFGTFTTRSGLIESVHSYTRSTLGPYLLAFVGLTLVASVALMLSRRRCLSAGPLPSAELLSRDGMFFLMLVLLLTLTGTVFVGSVLPTLTEALVGQRFEAGPDWFDRITGPQFAALVLVMGLCPLLGRALQGLRPLLRRGLPGLLGAVLLAAAAVAAGFTRPFSLVSFAAIGLAGGTALVEVGRGVSARRRRTNEAWPQALWRLFGQSRRRYGGFLVHLGVTLMAVGVVGTRAYPVEAELVVTPDEPVTAAGYTFVYQGLVQEPVGDRTSTRASLLIYEGGAYLTTLEPRLDRYREFDQTVAVPALRAGLWEDLYVVLAGWEEGGTTATLKLFVNPLAGFLWVGGLALLVGGAVALWPSAPAERLSAVQARWRTAGLVVGGLLLVVAGVAMWGSGPGTRLVDSLGSGLPGRSARLRPGEPASDFALDLLHGSTFTLSDLRGRVVVVNFWATWCPSCEDELDDLQAVWVEYRPEEVVLVGIAVQQDATVVQEMASRLGLTYPLGLDPRGRIGLAYGITAVPETFVVDPEGQVAFVHVGPVSAGQLRQELDRLLTP